MSDTDNIDFFESASKAGEWITIPQGRLYWAPHFFSAQQADEYFQHLSNELNWQQQSIRMFGRQVLQPRLQAWCGDVQYTYSGLTMKPELWTPTLLAIKAACEQAAGVSFNSVLANLYRHGQDYMGFHQDNEKELGYQPVIASVSFGEQRRFVLKHIETKQKIEFVLHSGSLLIMAGETQTCWLHSVPKTQKPMQPRINLTFRQIMPVDITG
ncbi:alpha-ketoglutarate-dependent dioxygenase AlkB [Photobacterium sp.]|uniref:alpha-ketoglutarate-dependent dioxygenase AlkB family protein n=1 Tax=Photobacterium sp. TaxID=660 RepID=UPI00299E4D96|nr:alpha-ketoglutarate-dependent dioxygenase AlkB [Photobacterium sp.]MDX1300990.1 alpha-ketoglutarate-dependent dioxygenase AlkB [Photobacterium sp.]